MDKLLYIAMQGAMNAGQAQATNSNNLANANTTGFKADFDAFISKPVYGPGFATRAYSLDEQTGVDFAAGNLSTTGRQLDIAVAGKGWIAVQNEQGEEAYTRRGDLRIDNDGTLRNGAGQAVMGAGGSPVVIPHNQSLTIAKDGSISIVPLGQAANTLALVDKIKLVNPGEEKLQKGQDGLFYSRDKQALPADSSVEVVSGALEGSNVNPVEAMVNMIQYSRNFEANTKMMKVAEDLDRSASKLLAQN